jgi:hypothetical protein
MRFRTVIISGSKTATGIEVPDEIVAGLGRGKRPPVLVTINGHTYGSTVAVMGGRFMVGVSAENRALAGVSGGDQVDVEIELDTEPRQVAVPDDLARALQEEPATKRFFDGLSYSKQQWFVLSVEGAKTPETRQRRVAKAIEMLRAERTR